MTEDERDDLIDKLPKNMPLWPDDEEAAGGWKDMTFEKWREALGHKPAHPGCCSECGCFGSCMLAVFHDGIVSSVVRELDKLGLLRTTEASR